MNKIIGLSIAVLLLSLSSILFNKNDQRSFEVQRITKENKTSLFNLVVPTPQPLIIPSSKTLENNNYHIFQTFNNCGPASLSMALSFYGISVNQKVLGDDLRPYQIINGDNDDKSVTLAELAEKSKEYGFVPIHRPNGNPEILKSFVAYDMPVIVRTWTNPDEDIGHFRVVKGYDDVREIIIQDDSLQGKNLEYSYEEFNTIWKKFNYEYLVLVPNEKLETVNTIIGEDLNENIAWKKAVEASQKELLINPNDFTSKFNLSVALYKVGNYQESVDEFEEVEQKLPFRTLWYQIEPIKAYYELGGYDKVFSITDRILNNGNRAYSEAYIVRGQSYLKQGKNNEAKSEFEKAVFYNKNLKSAQELFNSI